MHLPAPRISSPSIRCPSHPQFRNLCKKRHTEQMHLFLLFHSAHKDHTGGDSSNLSLRQAQVQFILNDQGHRGIFGETENPLIQGLGCNCLDLFFLQKLFRKRLPKTTVFRGCEQRPVNEHNALSSGLCIQLEHAVMCWVLSKHCLCLSAILIPIEKAVGKS